MDIGAIIKQRRLEKRMSLEEVGDIVGVGKSTVRKWENGVIKNMKRDKIAKLAHALDLPLGVLMGVVPPGEINDAPTRDSTKRMLEVALTSAGYLHEGERLTDELLRSIDSNIRAAIELHNQNKE